MKITSHVWFPTSERLAMIYKCVLKVFLSILTKELYLQYEKLADMNVILGRCKVVRFE